MAQRAAGAGIEGLKTSSAPHLPFHRLPSSVHEDGIFTFPALLSYARRSLVTVQ